MLEYAPKEQIGNMKKRSLLFAEALNIMNRMPNVYDRPGDQLRSYRLGFVKKDGR
jgi:hypothetical protein